ncbi:nitroreductase family protein [Burkholderia multivorans]|uniref:nitroreductase family protein n=1 Tax=Burkholderia multivorans TaxID=87883 RepID=UPI002019B176|nr:nitroreductase family protein [Burkholderia multivorans]MCL4646555.1 nitroreductase family protein [Burkholderia multivorans]UQN90502.1 nitroreductase family protein [Burkholderia multivorans]UQO75690.1 nitroreductase family protein [Burkholderia multivorans]UQP29409.1 nitroreductase family protein [Burkholderia multivorans]UQP41452.1 nitroreductase family protein [Burkholderia multivorans]
MTSPSPELVALDRLTSGRSTCRAYRHTALDRELIRSIVGMAGRSASWCNVQPWQLVVTETPESTERFRQALMERVAAHPDNESDLPFPPSYEGIYRERRRGAGLALYSALGIGPKDSERSAEQALRNFRLFDAPHVAIVTVPAELGPYALVDAGGFVSSFLIAAYAHGVATTPQGALARHARFVREYFGIPDTQHMICGISFGYVEDAHPVNQFRTTRAAVDDLLRFA